MRLPVDESLGYYYETSGGKELNMEQTLSESLVTAGVGPILEHMTYDVKMGLHKKIKVVIDPPNGNKKFSCRFEVKVYANKPCGEFLRKISKVLLIFNL